MDQYAILIAHCLDRWLERESGGGLESEVLDKIICKQVKGVGFRSIAFLFSKCYPTKAWTAIFSETKNVMTSMYESGFDIISILGSDITISFEEYHTADVKEWVFSLQDFLMWYSEGNESNPDIVEQEMENVKKFLERIMPRKNPFKVSISKQHCEFAKLESILNFDEFPSEILQDIVEFIHGEESLLL